MTDRVRSITVILDRDTRDDDAQVLVDAISLMRGVSLVKLGKVVGFDDLMAREAAGREIREQILAILYPERKP